MGSVLLDKSKAFSLVVIRLCNQIRKEKHENVLTKQLICSGTSIGANIHEAQYAESKSDFVHKFQVALKECFETLYWLELLNDSGYGDCSDAYNQCLELKKMLVSTINTCKAKQSFAVNN